MAATGDGVASETVQFVSDGVTVPAFLTRPAQAAAVPAILLLHEWWGLTDHIKDIARRFAGEGFAVLAPDLYARLGSKVTADPAEASALMAALSSQAILRDLNAATSQYLTAQPFVDAWRIGVVGFSMGGTFALTQAGHNSDLKAAVSFYGKVPPIETMDYLLCPVQYHYPGKDGWVTSQEVTLLKQGLEKFGKPGAVYTYPEADHAFFNDARPEVYRSDDAQLAWQRTLQFLAQHL